MTDSAAELRREQRALKGELARKPNMGPQRRAYIARRLRELEAALKA